jgi:hypothetical protein
MMRRTLGSLVAAAAAIVALTASSDARAEDEFDLSVADGKITVTA